MIGAEGEGGGTGRRAGLRIQCGGNAGKGENVVLPPGLPPELPEDLSAVMIAWPDLPASVRAGIVAMVKAVRP